MLGFQQFSGQIHDVPRTKNAGVGGVVLWKYIRKFQLVLVAGLTAGACY